MLLIELLDLRSDFTTEVEVEETMPMSKFLDLVRREMTLGYDTDVRFRRTISQGHVYMQKDAIPEFVDMLWEGADDPNDLNKRAPEYHEQNYDPENGVKTDDLFTVCGSSCLYIQGRARVRCTLLERY